MFLLQNNTSVAGYADDPTTYCLGKSTVKPVYSGHLRLLKKVSAITRCTLYRVLEFLGKKKTTEIKIKDFFSHDASKQYK